LPEPGSVPRRAAPADVARVPPPPAATIACDFCTVETLFLRRLCVLFLTEHA
jgi:hypothetical protein